MIANGEINIRKQQLKAEEDAEKERIHIQSLELNRFDDDAVHDKIRINQ